MTLLHWIAVYLFWGIVCRHKLARGQDVCGHPGAPANGTFYPIGATFRLNAAIRYSCDDGFILFGNEERVCLFNGTWTGDIPLCDRNVARGMSATQSGQFRNQKADLAIDGQVNTCASTAKTTAERWWQLSLGVPINVAMVAVTIGIGSVQDFSVYIVSSEEGDSRIVYNRCGNFSGMFEYNMVEISCNNGTGIKGEYVFIRDNRQGSFHFSLCEVEVFTTRDIDRPCGQPERPLRSVVRPYNKTVVQYSCQSGYTLNETSPFLNCVEGIWESPPPLCVDVYCRAPPPVPFSKLTPTYAEWFPSPDRTHFPLGAILNYTCYSGYIQEGSSPLVCTENGTWLGNQTKCWPTTCGTPPIVANGTVNFLNITTPTKIGSLIELRCHDGYLPVSKAVIGECLRNGTWGGLNALCIAESSERYENIQPALSAIVAVIVILGLVAVVVVVIIVLRKRGYLIRSMKMVPSENSRAQLNSDPESDVDGKSPAVDMRFNPNTVLDPDLYDDVWPSEKALVDDSQSGLYTDAISSSENLIDDSTLTVNRIYDQPDGCDEKAGEDHVYYAPVDTDNSALTSCQDDSASERTEERSKLPPADGAAVDSGKVSTTNGGDDDHIYEPLRHSMGPGSTTGIRKPVYAKVDLASKKHRRSIDVETAQELEDAVREPPEGNVAYSCPVFDGGSPNAALTSSGTSQRPLPPLPHAEWLGPSVMVDNALYSKTFAGSCEIVADNDIYDGVAST